MPRRLTTHFTLDELVFSQASRRKGLDNTPAPREVENLRLLADAMEEVRALLGDHPVLVSSGYRSPEVNREVGGARNSAHMFGLAADFTVPAAGTVLQVCRRISASSLGYQQLIHEFGGWVHLSIPSRGTVPRREDLSIFERGRYIAGIIADPASSTTRSLA